MKIDRGESVDLTESVIISHWDYWYIYTPLNTCYIGVTLSFCLSAISSIPSIQISPQLSQLPMDAWILNLVCGLYLLLWNIGENIYLKKFQLQKDGVIPNFNCKLFWVLWTICTSGGIPSSTTSYFELFLINLQTIMLVSIGFLDGWTITFV